MVMDLKKYITKGSRTGRTLYITCMVGTGIILGQFLKGYINNYDEILAIYPEAAVKVLEEKIEEEENKISKEALL
jgi:hypothetical protein